MEIEDLIDYKESQKTLDQMKNMTLKRIEKDLPTLPDKNLQEEEIEIVMENKNKDQEIRKLIKEHIALSIPFKTT
ncbi:hypothetical protein PPACK8108_LOCUS10880 [Phakopsora pachyrhizi]|uniref:Uncharacterized protein n=1 Tax=Phakopsora pachyrhizi TaxID=170000 RepID=A0AAV0B125_PHAPC|nr:hypothetical protein PPACK8108_LOCUS10880 [Phakopsora pachyrhizi]